MNVGRDSTKGHRQRVSRFAILDAFMGSDTTAVAAINPGRQFVGFENNEYYYKICLKRIEAALKV